jgi:hypothetical protein
MRFSSFEGPALGISALVTRTRRTLRPEVDYAQVTLLLSETTSVFLDDNHNAITLDQDAIFRIENSVRIPLRGH